MISVIIPAWNRAGSIRQAVESVLVQTVQDIEVIVVDDGSTDDTANVVESIRDERVRLIRQDNAGACAARNRGIDESHGEYIAFHDSDDLWHSDKLEKQLQAMAEYGADIVSCRLVQHKPDGVIRMVPEVMTSGFRDRRDNLFGFGTQTLLARREVFEKYRFDEQMPRFQEFELLLRITGEYPLYCMEDGLVDYFLSDNSITVSLDRLLRACDLLEKKHPWLLTDAPRMRQILGWRLEEDGRKACRAGRKDYRQALLRGYRYLGGMRGKAMTMVVRFGLYPMYLRLWTWKHSI